MTQYERDTDPDTSVGGCYTAAELKDHWRELFDWADGHLHTHARHIKDSCTDLRIPGLPAFHQSDAVEIDLDDWRESIDAYGINDDEVARAYRARTADGTEAYINLVLVAHGQECRSATCVDVWDRARRFEPRDEHDYYVYHSLLTSEFEDGTEAHEMHFEWFADVLEVELLDAQVDLDTNNARP